MISQRHGHCDVSLLSDLLSVSVSAVYQVLYSLIVESFYSGCMRGMIRKKGTV